MKKLNTRKFGRSKKGFSLIEVLVSMALVAIAMLGLAQLFVLSIVNNSQADRMTNAVFLVQQQIEQLRTFTNDELSLLPATLDELIDVNLDTTYDYRRITRVQSSGLAYEVRVLVFAGEQEGVETDALIADPMAYRARADMTTLISR